MHPVPQPLPPIQHHGGKLPLLEDLQRKLEVLQQKHIELSAQVAQRHQERVQCYDRGRAMPASISASSSTSSLNAGAEELLAPAPAMVGVQSTSKREIIKQIVGTWGGAVISVSAYLVAGGLIYTRLEGWSTIDAVYFSCVTMSTVGYGDFSPTNATTKTLTLFMILIGVISVFTQISMAFSTVTTPITRKGRELLACMCRRKKWDIDGDGEADFEIPLPAPLFYAKNLIPSVFLNVLLQMMSALIFDHLEGWGFGNAFYHCIVTATTVGYGDMSITTDGGKMWACFHILLSVVLLTEAISTIGILAEERKAVLARLKQLQRKLDVSLLDNLMAHATAIRPKVVRDGKGLTELESAPHPPLALPSTWTLQRWPASAYRMDVGRHPITCTLTISRQTHTCTHTCTRTRTLTRTRSGRHAGSCSRCSWS